jgi:selenocysteine lyase/cysteine desulfurase
MSLIPNQKALFDIPGDVVYLDCAAQSPALKASFAAGELGLGWKLHPWDPDRGQLKAEMERARELFGGLVGSPAENIALMTSTSYGTAIAAANLTLLAGQNIVLLQDQFPSNYYCWQHLAKRNGGQIKTVARPADGNWTAAVIDAIDENTGIVALPNCHWTDGGRLDLETIAPVVHRQGASFFIDATQSIGMHAFDVAKLNPDFVACSAYKWLLSPDASGYLYVAPRHLDGQPIEDNHAGRIGETSMEVGAGYGARYQTGAVRFDQGASDSMIHIPMSVSAMAQISAWGVVNIDATMRPLTDYIAEKATARSFKVPPSAHRVSHFIGLYPDAMPDRLIPQLKALNIHVSLRGGAIRVSPYLFNDREDVDQLFSAFDSIFSF